MAREGAGAVARPACRRPVRLDLRGFPRAAVEQLAALALVHRAGDGALGSARLADQVLERPRRLAGRLRGHGPRSSGTRTTSSGSSRAT